MRLKNYYVLSLAFFGTALQGCGADSAAFLLATGNGGNGRGDRSGAEQFRVGGVSVDPSVMRQTEDPGIKPKDLSYEDPSESASAELGDIPSAEVLMPKDSASNRPSESHGNLYARNDSDGADAAEANDSSNHPGASHGQGAGPRQQAEALNAISPNKPGSTLHLHPSQTQLWPPNHKLVSVSVQGQASTACQIVNVTDNESDLADDAIITGALSVDLRATRSGASMNGRIYTIELSCIDESGVSAQEHLEVVVPHDQGKKK